MLQEIEVVRNAGRGHGKFFTDLSRRKVLFAQHFQNAPASRVTQCFKEQVHVKNAGTSTEPGWRFGGTLVVGRAVGF